MREIQVAENKTLKLTNVLSRRVDPNELSSVGVILTQMENFIKSHSAMPVGPVIQCVKFSAGPSPEPEIYFMMQVNQLIPGWSPGISRMLCCGSRAVCMPISPAPWTTALWPARS